jgi:hypothetical protein
VAFLALAGLASATAKRDAPNPTINPNRKRILASKPWFVLRNAAPNLCSLLKFRVKSPARATGAANQGLSANDPIWYEMGWPENPENRAFDALQSS